MIFEGRGAGWTHLILSGARSFVPPYSSRTERPTVAVKAAAIGSPEPI